jgi:PhnB protein
MSKIIPFVTVKGALQALEFYKEIFHVKQVGDITMLSNIDGFEDHKFEGKVGHMTIELGESTFFMNDFLYEYPVDEGTNIQFVVDLESEENLRKAFISLSEDGEIIEELHEVFWGALFGTVKDKFGVTWQIYYGHK